VVKAPGTSIRYRWVWRSLQALLLALAVFFAIKYRTQLQAILQDTVRSFLKPTH
jgi:hypothetical protein